MWSLRSNMRALAAIAGISVSLGASATARAEIAPDPPALTLHGASAELEGARGLPIARVTIAGNRRVPAEDLAALLQATRPGTAFSPEGLARDVRALWGSGLVDDVSVDLTTGASGVSLRILVRERPTVKSVDFSGNEAIDVDDLKEAASASVKVGDVLNREAVRRAAQKIRDKYAEEGYFLAEVHDEVMPGKGGTASVRFTIVEHEKLHVRSVTFVGNHGVSTEELKEMMLTGKGGPLSWLGIDAGGPFREDMFERDIYVLNGLYYDKGYLAVQVGTPRIMLSPDRTAVEITIPIDEGPQFHIRALSIAERDEDGREIEPLGGRRHLREMVRAKAGDTFNRSELVKDLGAVQTMYRDAGYASVEATPGTELDPEHEAVDVRVAIRRHRLVRFGRIEIKGNTKTRDKVIRRELEIGEEALFSETALDHSRRRVQALGYFGDVQINTTQGADPDHLDVSVEVTEKPTGTFQVGAGFSSMESFLFNAQIQQNNLFGTGRSLSLQAQLSGVRQLFDLRFVEPHLADSPFSLSGSIFDTTRAYQDFSQTSQGGSLTLGYPLLAPHLYGTLTYTLEHDRALAVGAPASLGTSSAVSAFPRLPVANLWSAGITSSIKPAITYDARDNQLFPTSGAFLQASAEVAPAILGSENQFLRLRGTARFYHPITSDGSVVFRWNSEAGFVASLGGGGVPLYSRFFLGGIPDVRGFPLRSLGPRLPLRTGLDPGSAAIPDGANLGGNLMYYQNVEVEFPILKAMNIRGVVFTDLGNVWNTEGLYCHAAPGARAAALDPCFSARHILDMRASWGFGVRWLSPLGPLRFEWGFPFKPLPYEKPMDFQFTIGSAF